MRVRSLILSGSLILVIAVVMKPISHHTNPSLKKLDVLPREFSTPMFWSEGDLKQLEGTDIIGKSGYDMLRVDL